MVQRLHGLCLSHSLEISRQEFATRLARWFKVCAIIQSMFLRWFDLRLISCACVWMKDWTLRWRWSSSWFRCFSTCIMMLVWPPAVESYYKSWCPPTRPQPCSSSPYTPSHSWPHLHSSTSRSRLDVHAVYATRFVSVGSVLFYLMVCYTWYYHKDITR